MTASTCETPSILLECNSGASRFTDINAIEDTVTASIITSIHQVQCHQLMHIHIGIARHPHNCMRDHFWSHLLVPTYLLY